MKPLWWTQSVSRFDHALIWQRGNCYLCGRKMSLKKLVRRGQEQPGYETVTIDHVKPRCLGGRANGENVALAHYRCNAKAADAAPTACEIMFAGFCDVAWREQEEWRHRIWQAMNVNRLVSRILHGQMIWVPNE